jgi:hypothetical protein
VQESCVAAITKKSAVSSFRSSLLLWRWRHHIRFLWNSDNTAVFRIAP